MADAIRKALERLVTAYGTNEGLPIQEWIQIARAALAAEPPAPVPAADGEREELAQWLEKERPDYGIESYRLAGKRLHRAAALLREPAPAPGPTIDDIWQLCEDHEFHLGMDGANEEESAEGLLEIINTALGRWGRPASVPVPVAARPWERPGWCDAQGRCWWLVPNQSWPCLYLMKADSALAASGATHCLPHWAIPQQQSEEVQ